MRAINVGTQKRTKKKGAITREEMIERDAEAKRLAKKHKKTERLVCIYKEPKTWYHIREGETLEECRNRYNRTHGKPLIMPVQNDSGIPIRFIK